MITAAMAFLSTITDDDAARRVYRLGARSGAAFVVLGFVMAMCILVVMCEMHTEYDGDLASGPGWWLAVVSTAMVLLGGMAITAEPGGKSYGRAVEGPPIQSAE